jgi:acetylornithine deacetylase
MQFGPGRLEECHAVNEYVEAESYLEAILVYAQLILEWCKANK